MTTLTFYPPIAFNLSPTWRVWARLTAADVHHRLHVPKIYHGRNLYCFLNHPILFIRIVGMVIALDVYEFRTVLTLDDGSGELMEAIVYAPDADQYVRGVNIGDIVKARGVINEFRGRMQMVLKKPLQPLRSTAEEMTCWQEMVDWKQEVLVKPWTVCEEELAKEKHRVKKAQRDLVKLKEREKREYGGEEDREKKFSGRRRPDGWKKEESDTEKPRAKKRRRQEPPRRELDDIPEAHPEPELMIIDDTEPALQNQKNQLFTGRRRPEGYQPPLPGPKWRSPPRPRHSGTPPLHIPEQQIPLLIVNDTIQEPEIVDDTASLMVKVIDDTATTESKKFSGRRRPQDYVRPRSPSPPPIDRSTRPRPPPPPLPDHRPHQELDSNHGIPTIKTFSGRRRQPKERPPKPPDPNKPPSKRSLKALLREHILAEDLSVTTASSLRSGGFPFASTQLLSLLAADGYLLPPNSQGEWIVVGPRQLRDIVEKEMRRGVVEERRIWKKAKTRGGVWEGVGKDAVAEVVGRMCEADGGWTKGAKGWIKAS